MDITDEVNSLITGGTTNYGYGISFERDLEINSVKTITICWVLYKTYTNIL